MIANYPDHSANERTFLAWVRTVMAIVGFGLAGARLSGQAPPLWSELALLLTGATVMLLAFVRMRWLRRRIASAELLADDGGAADALLVALVAALLATLAAFAVHVA